MKHHSIIHNHTMEFRLLLVLISFLLLLLLLPLHTTAQTRNNNITLGSSLTANDKKDSWVSPSGDFALGFRRMNNNTNGTGGNNYLLAIWFNKIPDETIVWSANGNNLAQEGSKVEFTKDGNFLLNDPRGKNIWSADFVSNGVAYAAMLDSGNFVVVGDDSGMMWQSFEKPTDTILPTQVMNLGGKLVARYMANNYSSGRFQFALSDSGNLELSTTNYPLTGDVIKSYWDTGSTDSGFQLIFNQTGSIYLTARNGSVINQVSPDAPPTSQFYQRAVIDYDGVFRHYVYPKSPNSPGGRPMGWTVQSYEPSNICTSITQSVGGGACGFNSYCEIGIEQRPTCKCPPGYTYIDPNDVMNGCKANFSSQSCDKELNEADQFTFQDLPSTDWPWADYAAYSGRTEEWCRESCLNDCFCDVAIFRDGSCWKKKNPLSNGKADPGVGGKAMVKVRRDNSTVVKPAAIPGAKKKEYTALVITGSAILASSVILNLLLLLSASSVFPFFSNQKEKTAQQVTAGVAGMNLRSFSYKELEEATDGFSEELGSGGFGKVFKGVLKREGGTVVAVKVLEKEMKEGEKEFVAELSAIGKTNHKNLVQLLGYCKDGKRRILVYEFMSNGSLASFLFQNPRPAWYVRMQIAFGIARGLCYLHEECSTQIIHCDIKPENILLDDQFTSRISDFGLAKLLKTDQTHTITAIRGTKGYVAPEWFKNMPITVKVDVYSFGIMLLELICVRKHIQLGTEPENEHILADWAVDCYSQDTLHLLVESDEEAMDNIRKVERFVMIAIWCIQDDPSLRPTMKKVTQMLEGAVTVSAPPEPYSFISSI